MEYYSALKKKEILSFVTTWMDLEDIMLSEISQSQKENPACFPLYEISKGVKLIETEIRRVDGGWQRQAWDRGRGIGSYCSMHTDLVSKTKKL